MSLLISGKGNKYVSIDNDTRGTASRSTLTHTHIRTPTRKTCTSLLAYTWLQRLIGYLRKMSTSIFRHRSVEIGVDDSLRADFSKSSLLRDVFVKWKSQIAFEYIQGNASLFYRISISRLSIVTLWTKLKEIVSLPSSNYQTYPSDFDLIP